jgi:predicted dehydrogenase
VLVTEAYHPFWSYWWPHGHIIGWEHTFVHEIAHLLDAIVHNKDVAPYGATFEDGYRNAVICDAIEQSSREARRVAIHFEG